MEISRPSEAYIRPVESETVHLLPCTMYSAMFTKFPNQLLSRAKTNQFTVSQTHTHTHKHNQGASIRTSGNHVAADLRLRRHGQRIGMTFLTKKNNTQCVVQKSVFVTKFRFLSYGFRRT